MGLLGNILNLGVNVIKTPFAVADDVLSGRIIDPDEKTKTKEQLENIAKDVENTLDDVFGDDE